MSQKRAILLYRVSTDEQDLKAQQDKCRRFCSEKNFLLLDEVEEHGVSGYKLKLAQRTELLEILRRAENHEFEVLIVFMFDRLSRREDTTPFLIQKLSEYGVEVYTAENGQLVSSEKHEDKLMNYMQSWIAEYESIKTSLRIKNKMYVMNKNNQFTGGSVPFGYEFYTTGEVKENGKIKHDIRIHPEESEIIKKIFDLSLNYNYGAQRIANYLNEHCYKNRTITKRISKTESIQIDCKFRNNSINRILRNPIYTGRQLWNKTNSTQNKIEPIPRKEWKLKEVREDLIIIDSDIFNKVQQLLTKRQIKPSQSVNVPTKSQLLCTGLAQCHCGGKIKIDYTTKKYTRKDGQVTKRHTMRYLCFNGKNHRVDHDGSVYFAAKKYDQYVIDALKRFYKTFDISRLKEQIDEYKKNNIITVKQEIDNLNKQKEQYYSIIQKYEIEVDKLIMIENEEEKQDKMNILIKGIKRNEQTIQEVNLKIKNLSEQLKINEQELINYNTAEKQFSENFIDEFLNSPLDKQKAMLTKILDGIIFFKEGVRLKIKLLYQKCSVEPLLKEYPWDYKYAPKENYYIITYDYKIAS